MGIFASACALGALISISPLAAQVLTIDTSGKGTVAGNGPVDHQFTQVTPTHVELSKTPLDAKTRLLLIREMQSEQGFAMRPFPRGHKGLTLEANGKLEPAGESYLTTVVNEGLSAKPGARVVITNIRFDKNRIIFDLNDGPDARHRFLRHVQIGMGPDMGDPDIDPTIANQQGDPTGARLTLTFKDDIPDLTSKDVKALLAPLISFDVKTPVQAFTDTLPVPLKDAILGHQVLVGMTTDMVLFSKGHPVTKSREMDGQVPFEEWVYGAPPEEVDFVRINGNRVIRVEIAKDGESPQIFTKDVVSAMLRSDGTAVLTAQTTNTHTVHEGDVADDTDKRAPAAPPSLRNPGETLPTDNSSVGIMRPVQMPKPHPEDLPGANPDEQQQTPGDGQATAPPANAQSPPANTGKSSTDGGRQPAAPAHSSAPPAASSSQFVTTSSVSRSTTRDAAQPN